MIDSISGIKLSDAVKPHSTIQQPDKSRPSFNDTLKEMFNEVNELQADAKTSVGQFLDGDLQDVHQVMIAAEKAGIGLQLSLAIRNKLLDAYRTTMRMLG